MAALGVAGALAAAADEDEDDEPPPPAFMNTVGVWRELSLMLAMTCERFSFAYILPSTSTRHSEQYGLPLYAHTPDASRSE